MCGQQPSAGREEYLATFSATSGSGCRGAPAGGGSERLSPETHDSANGSRNGQQAQATLRSAFLKHSAAGAVTPGHDDTWDGAHGKLPLPGDE
eukprot:scaffold1220_cov259-Pinguiococcus_pyrenoidosus.AAC.67